MIKTLRPVGNSLGLIIDRPILELLGIDRRTQLRLRTDGRVLYIEPVGRAGSGDTGPLPVPKAVAVEKAPKRPGRKMGR
jgi:antitoxin component of MazEF toxin-antitoxin module